MNFSRPPVVSRRTEIEPTSHPNPAFRPINLSAAFKRFSGVIIQAATRLDTLRMPIAKIEHNLPNYIEIKMEPYYNFLIFFKFHSNI